MISRKEMYFLLDDASDCALFCLNDEKNKKRPSQGAINHLQDVYDRLITAREEYAQHD